MEYDPSATIVETLSMAVGVVLSLIVTVPMIGAPAAAIPEIVELGAALLLLLQPTVTTRNISISKYKKTLLEALLLFILSSPFF
jgi:Na+-translocating ferredoxin:NAD+ oxidoreductase RnfE subunit